MTGEQQNLCMNCMADLAENSICPHCGWNNQNPQMLHALTYRTLLQKRYIVGRAKKINGEGITYIGYDTALNCVVEIREFFPQTVVQRAENKKDVMVLSGNEILFDEYLTAYLNYARDLAHMRELSSIIPVYDIFEENHTAYSVYAWEECITLRYFVERSGGHLNWNSARQLFMPVLSSLSAIHAANMCHLGISPDSLYIMPNGKMKLGDFCIGQVRQQNTDLVPDLSEGCAAIEQYVMDYTPDEATDVYGFTASLFFALTGKLPPDALHRRGDSRLLIPTGIVKALPPYVVTAMANALQVSPDKRTHTFERLRAELSAAPTVTASAPINTETIPTELPPPKHENKKNGYALMLLSCICALAVMALVTFFWLKFHPSANINTDLLANTSSDFSSAQNQSEKSLISTISSEPENMISAPNLTGQKYDDLMSTASATEKPNYTVLLSKREFSNTIPEGYVISQTPVAGTSIARGTAVVVVVSKGSNVRKLPDVSGLSLAEASEKVSNAGFTPTKVEEYSATVPEGKIVGYQKEKAGMKIEYGSQVTLVLSKGPKPES